MAVLAKQKRRSLLKMDVTGFFSYRCIRQWCRRQDITKEKVRKLACSDPKIDTHRHIVYGMYGMVWSKVKAHTKYLHHATIHHI